MSNPDQRKILSMPVLAKNTTIALKLLDNHGAGSTAAVADSDTAKLAFLLPEHTEKGGDDTSTRAAERVAEGDGTTVKVDLILFDVEELHIDQGDDGESLVDLVGVDLLLSHASVLESFGNCEGRCSGEFGW